MSAGAYEAASAARSRSAASGQRAGCGVARAENARRRGAITGGGSNHVAARHVKRGTERGQAPARLDRRNRRTSGHQHDVTVVKTWVAASAVPSSWRRNARHCLARPRPRCKEARHHGRAARRARAAFVLGRNPRRNGVLATPGGVPRRASAAARRRRSQPRFPFAGVTRHPRRLASPRSAGPGAFPLHRALLGVRRGREAGWCADAGARPCGAHAGAVARSDAGTEGALAGAQLDGRSPCGRLRVRRSSRSGRSRGHPRPGGRRREFGFPGPLRLGGRPSRAGRR